MDFSERIKVLPVAVYDLFGSNEPRLAIERACFLYNVFEDDIEKLSSPIADIFLKDLQVDKLPLTIENNLKVARSISYGIAYEIANSIFKNLDSYFINISVLLDQWSKLKANPLISEEKARKRVLEIEPWLLDQEKEKEQEKREAEIAVKKEQVRIDRISLQEALEKYPKLGEQTISTNMLKSKFSGELLKPSIKNWIKDYRDNVGSLKHDSLERVNFLFHGENGKRLTNLERMRVTLLFKSLEENTPLSIDPEKQIVIFDLEKPREPQRAPMNNAAVTPARDVFERSLPQHNHSIATGPVRDSLHNFQGQGHVRKEMVSPVQNQVKKDVLDSRFHGNDTESVAQKSVPPISRVAQDPIQRPVELSKDKIKEDQQSRQMDERIRNFAPQQTVSYVKKMQEPANLPVEKSKEVSSGVNYSGGRTINAFDEKKEEEKRLNYEFDKKERDYGFRSPDISGLIKSIPKKPTEKVEELFNKGIGVGSDDYFASPISKMASSGGASAQTNRAQSQENQVRFSAPQQLPVEKQQAVKTEPQVAKAQPVQNPVQLKADQALSQPQQKPRVVPRPVKTPFRITPLGDEYEGSVDDLQAYQSKNVVDLR